MDTAHAELVDPAGLKTKRVRIRKFSPRKIDPKKVQELHAKGLNSVEIAKHQGVNPSSVWRFLDSLDAEKKQVERFKSNRADVLASLHGEAVSLQKKVIESLARDGVLDALTPPQKSNLLFALNATAGTSFDKERLERGQSTQNISTLSRMIDNRVGSLYTRNPLIDKQSANPDESGS